MIENKPPLVSIIIPSYNYELFITKAIDSVLSQSYTNWQLIVVDNFSQDGTQGVVHSYQDQRLSLYHFANGGSIGAARNFGWQKANGSLITFLDADDFWLPDKLEIQVHQHNSMNLLSFHDLKMFGSKKAGTVRGRKIKSTALTNLLTHGNPIATSSVMISHELMTNCGGFPERTDYFAAEDYALWLLAAKKGAEFNYIPKTLGGYRIHGSSNSVGVASDTARLVTSEYLDLLSSKERAQLSGWLAYGQGVYESSIAQKARLFTMSLRKSVWRFKWRSAIRILLLVWTEARSLLAPQGNRPKS